MTWTSVRGRVLLTLVAVLVVAIASRGHPVAQQFFAQFPRVHVVVTAFLALVVQSLPFVLVGSMLSATVALWMTPDRWARVLPRRGIAAVVVAALVGVCVPTCECSSVPLAKRMMNSGVTPAAAITVMLAAPSANPLVVYATFTAFGGWEMAAARLVAGMLAVVGVGVCVMVWGGRAFAGLGPVAPHDDGRRSWWGLMSHDAVDSLTFLCVGAFLAAVINLVMPVHLLVSLSHQVVFAVVIMMTLAIVASLCSFGDAFVAASLVGVHPAGMLGFMVVGPIIDMKLASMMEGILGDRPTRFIAVSGFVSALVATLTVAWLWGWWG